MSMEFVNLMMGRKRNIIIIIMLILHLICSWKDRDFWKDLNKRKKQRYEKQEGKTNK